MRRTTRTAFSALASLDPIPSLSAHRDSRPDDADATIEIQIARILAVPGGDATAHRGVRARRLPTARAARRARPRYGALGLAASAALAVIATVLWVSPSAGQPVGQASVAHAEVIHPDVVPAATGATGATGATWFIR
jgi:hypothetical protein